MSTTSSLINALIVYGAFQALFIAFVVRRSQPKTLFKLLFAALLVVEGIILIERLLVETEVVNSVPHLLGIAYPISFLKPPLLFFMALSITEKDLRLEHRHGWHLIPFCLLLVMNLPFYFLSGAEKLASVQAFMEAIPSYRDFGFYFALSFFVYISIYIWRSLQQLHAFRQQVANNALVNWYRVILLAYSVFLGLHLIYFLIQPLGQFNWALINQLSMLSMTFIIQAIAFKLINQSTFFNTRPPDLGSLEQRQRAEERILQQLEHEKIYLDEDLNLDQLARVVRLSPSQASELINQRFGCSFKQLIKRYRLNEAKQILKNSEGGSIKLIEVAYASGFANKVSFYRAFRDLERMSPSAYLEQLRNDKKTES
ncbi:MAG: helix-turn-helix domain-containing protein [Bacteroidota bacterium]